MALPLSQSFESGSNGTTVTQGSGGNTAGGGSFMDTVAAGTGTTVTFSSAQAMHGGLSVKMTTGTTAAATSVGWSTSMGTQTTLFGRTYFFCAANAAQQDPIVVFRDSSSNYGGGIQYGTAHQLFTQNAAFAQTTIGTLTLSTWYRIEWKLICSTTTGTLQVNVYVGDSTTAAFTLTTAAGNWRANCASCLIGWPLGSAASQPDVYFDDFALSGTGFIGPVVTPARLPSFMKAQRALQGAGPARAAGGYSR